ncbi:DNA polymerase III subunit alpha [Pseudoroseomonas wenyumeiae]|uniref:Error-prone DNA polymerase n=1 Tax=Teichococcus wenyumeiae TaxID=2478470 RepID=A0A3A9JFF1_9PROT|nr:error-prone DNA polymerase [Pseudoroseomonas wenyumeiae]RKK02356.1 DNA polymerase III subunit alpha [Pseudoroseomonas wenyumeiae]RMI16927.1 DNA polymerase III subunit alpha [Pseudoroseomonas wenyumeiae]
MPGYAELGARSNFSLLDGASHPAELVAQAKTLGHTGIGICDTNSLAGVVRGHVAAKELGLPFVVGTRLLLADGAEYLAWPTDRRSYGRLTTLLSRGRMRSPKGECDLTRDELLAHAQGWCLALMPPLRPDATFADRLRQDAAALRGRLALPLFCGAWCRLDGEDRPRLDRLASMAEAADAALLASGDVRYHHRDRRRLADVLTAIRLGRTVETLGRAAERNGERALRSSARMARLFARHPAALGNTLRVLDACSGFSLAELRHEYPDEILEPGRTPQQTLSDRVWVAAQERWPGGVPEDIQARIRHELALIAQLDYAAYFLTVHEIVRFARHKGILCQGRGSAANSTCCYVLGITAVDPSKHDLLFERFVSANRNEPPDIDVDFEHERREEVIQHIYERYGRERAAIAGTVIRYRARSAVREVGKALGLSEDVTAKLAKGSWGPGRDSSLSEVASSEGLDPTDRRLALALELAEDIQDFPRHLATHVGGFVMSRGPLIELAVVTNAAMEGRTTLEWDKDDIDALGLLKVDVLALGMLSCLRRGFALLRQHHRIELDLAGVPKDCPQTYAMLRRADSLGVFQVESRAQMNMLPRLRPERFYDLVIQVAIIRPGPIQGDMVHPYLRRRWGEEEPVYPQPGKGIGHPDELKNVLQRTLGVPLFQEQAMRVAMVAADFSPEEADKLRRAMATFKHTQGVGEYRARLIGGMVKRGYHPELAERVFKQIEGFGSYGFPESHAASFAHLAYASSWLKCHHPTVFAAALLNSQPMGFYAPAQIVRDAREHGVEIRPLDVNASLWDCALEPEQRSAEGYALRLGLRLAQGLSAQDGQQIVKARSGGNGSPFASPEEVVRRANIGRKAMEALAQADAFGSMGTSRREALWAAKGVEHDVPPLLRLAAQQAAVGEPPLLPEPAPDLPPESMGQAVVLDYTATGLTLGDHPLTLLRPQLRALGCRDTREIATLPPGSRVKLAGLVLMRQRPGTAKGVVFVTIEDEHGTANLVVWADVGARDRAALLGARLLLVEAKIERETRHAEVPITHLICRALIDRTDLLNGLMHHEANLPWGDAALGRADEVRRPEPSSRRPVRMPGSRDFH